MAANDPFGLEASGIPPEIAAQYRGLTRQQAIAEALMKQGIAPGGGAINTGKFLVAPSPLEGLSKIAQILAGRYTQNQTDEKMAELGSKYAEMQKQQMADYLKQRNGEPAKPAVTLPPDVAGPVRDAQPAVPGDPRGAAIQAILSRDPRLQKIGQMDLTEAQKQAAAAILEAGRNQRHLTPSGSAVLGQEGANQRHATASGSAILGNQGAMQRHATPSGSTQANIAAMAPQRAAMTQFYGTNTAARAADTQYRTGIEVPGLPPGVATQQQWPIPMQRAPDEAAALAAAKAAEAQGLPVRVATPGYPADDKPLVPGIGQPQLSPAAREKMVIAQAGRQDRAPTAQEQKMVDTADAAVLSNQQAVGYLSEALKLNEQAMGFPGAGAVATAGSILPERLRPKIVDATNTYDNLVKTSVLPNLKATFGGNPTEGERKILLEVAGSSSMNPAVRKGVLERAMAAANARAKFNQDRAASIRNRSFFQPPGGAAPAAPAAAPSGAPRSFASEAEAAAAGIQPGTKVIINGVPGTWQ